MNKIEFDGFRFIDGGVCAAKGFKANGIQCGLKDSMKQCSLMNLKANGIQNESETMTDTENVNPSAKKKNDIAVIYSDKMCSAAAVYTSNKVKGAPIAVTKSNISDGYAQGVIVNSVNANTCNADGPEKAEKMCELAANELGLKKTDIIVASTGVIGQPLPIEPIINGIGKLCSGLSYTGNDEAVKAIMTTDTMLKEVAIKFELDGKECHLGGMLKGSGMIHPNMATTLSFLTSDISITPTLLQTALSDVIQETLNCVSVDGDQSTNDMCCVMANGLAENKTIEDKNSIEYKIFRDALHCVLTNLARMMARDGEGATKLITCEVTEADSVKTARTVAKSVITSSLFKAAMFGEDANWGRILCAIGYADAEFDINKVDVDIASKAGIIEVCRNGAGVEFSEEKAKKVLQEEEIDILVSLNSGRFGGIAYGCDLTYEYVKINGDYRS